MKGIVLAFALICVVSSPGPRPQAQAGQNVDYDTFCKLPDAQAKRTAFLATSSENRAVLVRTQIERWRDANRARLSDKQLSALADLIAAITPDTYGEGPKAEEARVKARPLAEAQRTLFTNDEIQAMQPNGPCIAKVK